MLADQVDHVIGVDTHCDAHELAVVAASSGGVVARSSQRANPRGYAETIRFAAAHAPGRRVWAIEGTGHYGAGLARYLALHGEAIVEVGRMPRSGQRLEGKDDRLDAIRAARAALGSDKLAVPRVGERREALRMLLSTRRSAVEVRRQSLTQLRSMIVTAPEELREQLRSLPTQQLLTRCGRLRGPRSGSPDELAAVLVLRTLAQRIHAATHEATTLKREILGHVRAVAPELLDEPGVGPIVAAQLIVSWSHEGRVRSESAFARLAGAAPIPASSGHTTRHRLSRGGDRQLNRALHTVILYRRHNDPATKAYIARRIAEGKSSREAVRLLKRYLARHLYRVLNQAGKPAIAT